MNTDFTQSCLVGVDLRGADLQGADFRGSTISEADFTGADLTGAHIANGIGAVTYDSLGQPFDRPIYNAAHLDSIDFTGSSGYQFYDARITGATFRNSSFDGLNFSVINNGNGSLVFPYDYPDSPDKFISSKLFAEADLRGASFVGANFVGADLSAAYGLGDANLEGVYYNESTVWPTGFQPPKSADCYLVTPDRCVVYE